MVSLIPFVTMSQKRSTKGKTTEKSENSTKLKSNFMIIKGVEMIIEDSRRVEKLSEEEESEELSIKRHLKPMTKLMVTFDLGSNISKDNQSLMAESRNLRNIDAVNKSFRIWLGIINSTIVIDGKAYYSLLLYEKKIKLSNRVLRNLDLFFLKNKM